MVCAAWRTRLFHKINGNTASSCVRSQGRQGLTLQKLIFLVGDSMYRSSIPKVAGRFLGQRSGGPNAPSFRNWSAKPGNDVEIMPGGQVRYTTTEPPRIYRRVVCSTTKRPYRVSSGLHRTPPLLLLVGRIRWGRASGGCYTNRPI